MLVYIVRNLKNGKIYIGQTQYDINWRKRIHYKDAKKSRHNNSIFHKAIRKYDKEDFNWSILCTCDNKDELDEMEFHYIKQYNSFIPNGYNMTFGGEGKTKGSYVSLETRNKISYSLSLEGYINRDKEDEYHNRIKKMSDAQKERFKDINEREKVVCRGEKNGMYGKCHTIETRRKISQKNKGHITSIETRNLFSEQRKGEKNGMFGNGHLLKGEKNGRSKIWKVISPTGDILFIKGNIDLLCNKYNIDEELIRRYRNKIVPQIVFRGKLKHKRNNTVGWGIFEIDEDTTNYPNNNVIIQQS